MAQILSSGAGLVVGGLNDSSSAVFGVSSAGYMILLLIPGRLQARW
jgi:hypothetical protein